MGLLSTKNLPQPFDFTTEFTEDAENIGVRKAPDPTNFLSVSSVNSVVELFLTRLTSSRNDPDASQLYDAVRLVRRMIEKTMGLGRWPRPEPRVVPLDPPLQLYRNPYI